MRPNNVDTTRTRAYVIAVIDSTAVPHGPDDPRAAAHATGLGRGEIVLFVDERDAPVRYAWSPKSTHEHATSIALGEPL